MGTTASSSRCWIGSAGRAAEGAPAGQKAAGTSSSAPTTRITATKNTAVVDDAVGMMAALVDRLQSPDGVSISSDSTAALDLDGVEELLSTTERRHG